MSLVAPVKDGKVVNVTDTESKETKTSNSTLDKEAFLQLLVTQMKYQDPLEPTSNTEYISQLAQFSALEEMQNVSRTMDMQRASGLVGQEVYVKTVDSTTGNTDYVHGLVDFVSFQNGKAYVSVGGKTYPLDNVDSVYNPQYTEAYDLAYEWTIALNKLPSLAKLTLSDKEDVMDLKDTYDKMTDYQKTFLTAENKEKLENYVHQIELLQKAKDELDQKLEEANKKDEENTDKSDQVDETEKTDPADKADETDQTDKVDEAEKTDPAGKTDKTDETSKSEPTDKTETDSTQSTGDSNQTQEAEKAGAGQTAEETDGGSEAEPDEENLDVE